MLYRSGTYLSGPKPGIVCSMGDPGNQFTVEQTGHGIDMIVLLQGVAAGDREAFTHLYKTTSRRLYGVALRVTQQRELADDALSETFLQVWRQAGRFDPSRGSVIGWLSVICRSRALDVLRRRGVVEPGVAPRAGCHRSALADNLGPPELLLSVESHSSVHAALAQLNEQQRQLLGLAYFRDCSHSELVSYTGLPLGTVKSQLRRGVEKLRKIMNGEPHG